MIRKKFSRFLEKQGKSLRLLGIYSAVILLMFSLSIPIIQQRLAEKNTVVPVRYEIEDSPEAVILPAENSEAPPDTSVKEEIPAPEALPPAAEDKPVAKETSKEANQSSREQQDSPVDITRIIWPLQGKIIQEVGLGYSKTFSDYRYHNGIDIEAARGTQVNNSLPGKVISGETSRGEAKKITVDHGSGWISVYAQLEEVYVQTGDFLKSGQAIGHIGQPGINEVLEGPHLHYSLLKDGQNVNPLDYLPK